MAEEGQHASDRPAQRLPDSLTRLLSDPTARVEETSTGDPGPTLFDRVLWWFNVAAFGAVAFVTSATLTVKLLP